LHSCQLYTRQGIPKLVRHAPLEKLRTREQT
jgi:hypothetical protein